MAFALDNRGGGQALPPFLQGRKPAGGGDFITKPIVTPKASIVPGEAPTAAKKPLIPTQSAPGNYWGLAGQTIQGGGISPATAPKGGPINPNAQPGPQGWGTSGISLAGANTGKPNVDPGAAPGVTPPAAQTLYDFLKSDLEAKRKTAMSGAVSDAASRGVYYGTPLTTSQGDIQTEFLKGLGSLQANVLQNEQGNQLERLKIATTLLNSAPQAQGGGLDPNVYALLGQLFADKSGGERTGPVFTPPTAAAPKDVKRQKVNVGNRTQSQ